MKNKLILLLTVVAMLCTLPVSAKGPGEKKGQAGGPGQVLIGVEASDWDSSIPGDPAQGILPIGGSGQVNGEFTLARRYGIEIGLRAQQRFVGPIPAFPGVANKTGIYEAAAGSASIIVPLAQWNYDWHVDLRDAFGVARGTTLGDYTLTLETDIAEETLFGFVLPLDLTFGGFVGANTVLWQSSQNPSFGNPDFDPGATGTYTFSLVLTPKTFNGPPLRVSIRVNVS